MKCAAYTYFAPTTIVGEVFFPLLLGVGDRTQSAFEGLCLDLAKDFHVYHVYLVGVQKDYYNSVNLFLKNFILPFLIEKFSLSPTRA